MKSILAMVGATCAMLATLGCSASQEPAVGAAPAPKAAEGDPSLQQVLKAIIDRETLALTDGADGDCFERRGRAHLGLGNIDLAVADLGRAVALKPKDAVAHIILARGLLWQLKAAGDAKDEQGVKTISDRYALTFKAAGLIDIRFNYWVANGAFGDPTKDALEADAWLWLALDTGSGAVRDLAWKRFTTPTDDIAKRVIAEAWNPTLLDRMKIETSTNKRFLEFVAAARKKQPELARKGADYAVNEEREVRNLVIQLGVASGDPGVMRKYRGELNYFLDVAALLSEPSKQ
jgi:hypothetical protein